MIYLAFIFAALSIGAMWYLDRFSHEIENPIWLDTFVIMTSAFATMLCVTVLVLEYTK